MCYVYDAKQAEWNPRFQTDSSSLATQNIGKQTEGKNLSVKDCEGSAKTEKRVPWQVMPIIAGIFLLGGFFLWRKLRSRRNEKRV